MPYSKLGWWLLVIAIGVVICWFTPVKLLFDEPGLESQLHKFGNWAAVLYLLLFVGATLLGFPGNVLTVAGGAFFGLPSGIVLSQLGATIGAVGAFWLARYALHDWIQRRFGAFPLLQRLNRAIAQNPFSFVLAMRFSPLSPFSLVNFLFGLTPIKLKTYTIGTFLGIIPLTITYTWLGVTGKATLRGGDRLPLLLGLVVLTLLSLAPLGLKSRRQVE